MFKEVTSWDHQDIGGNFTLIPKGTYKFIVSKFGAERNQDGEAYVKLEFTCLEGEHKGSKFTKSYQFMNFDLKVVEKAYQHWVNLCRSAKKKVSPNNPEQLANSIVTLGVDIFESKEGKKYQFISEYPDSEGASATAPQQPQQQTNIPF